MSLSASRRRPLSALVSATAILLAPVVARPLGTFAAPLALILVLPPMAAGLEALGWAERIGEAIRARVGTRRRPPVLFLMWSVMSALLSLDVAAVAAADVGLEVAGDAQDERAAQLRAAVLGSNVGSMLFPFSNLTNLVLVSATGMAFGTYVIAAVGPQLVAVLAGAVLLVREGLELRTQPSAPRDRGAAPRPRAAMLIAGAAAVLTSLVAIGVGFAGGEVDIVFAVGAAVVAAAAVGADATRPLDLARSLPRLGIVLIVASGILLGPIQSLASGLVVPDGGTSALVLIGVTLVGGLLAATINNLPAAALGAVWLAGADPVTVIAYLVGTNIVCVLTPHGSVATMLSHAVARRRGVEVDTRSYLRRAWKDAAIIGACTVVALIWAR